MTIQNESPSIKASEVPYHVTIRETEMYYSHDHVLKMIDDLATRWSFFLPLVEEKINSGSSLHEMNHSFTCLRADTENLFKQILSVTRPGLELLQPVKKCLSSKYFSLTKEDLASFNAVKKFLEDLLSDMKISPQLYKIKFRDEDFSFPYKNSFLKLYTSDFSYHFYLIENKMAFVFVDGVQHVDFGNCRREKKLIKGRLTPRQFAFLKATADEQKANIENGSCSGKIIQRANHYLRDLFKENGQNYQKTQHRIRKGMRVRELFPTNSNESYFLFSKVIKKENRRYFLNVDCFIDEQ